MDIVVITINVRGLRDRVKRRAVFDFIYSYKCSICFVQEVHLRDGGNAKTFTREWGRGAEGKLCGVWGVYTPPE